MDVYFGCINLIMHDGRTLIFSSLFKTHEGKSTREIYERLPDVLIEKVTNKERDECKSVEVLSFAKLSPSPHYLVTGILIQRNEIIGHFGDYYMRSSIEGLASDEDYWAFKKNVKKSVLETHEGDNIVIIGVCSLE